MGERRLWHSSKYAPPGDLDVSKIPRRQPENQPIRVRMPLPISLRCDTCGNIMYKGTKFNSRKECCIGEMYLEIQLFRFYFKCNSCSAKITLKTDPQISDYTVESGATRNSGHLYEDKAINGSSEFVLNPTIVLTKTNGSESANEEGNEHSTLSTIVNPYKKQKTEPTAGLDDCEEQVPEKNTVTPIK